MIIFRYDKVLLLHQSSIHESRLDDRSLSQRIPIKVKIDHLKKSLQGCRPDLPDLSIIQSIIPAISFLISRVIITRSGGRSGSDGVSYYTCSKVMTLFPPINYLDNFPGLLYSFTESFRTSAKYKLLAVEQTTLAPCPEKLTLSECSSQLSLSRDHVDSAQPGGVSSAPLHLPRHPPHPRFASPRRLCPLTRQEYSLRLVQFIFPGKVSKN